MRNLLGACAVLSKPTVLVAFTVLQIEVEESVSITDHKGNEQGRLQVRNKRMEKWSLSPDSELRDACFLSFYFVFVSLLFIYLFLTLTC